MLEFCYPDSVIAFEISGPASQWGFTPLEFKSLV